jgi:ferredoxin
MSLDRTSNGGEGYRARQAAAGWRLDEGALRRWIHDLLASGRRVLAPVERDGLRQMRPIAEATEVCLAAGKTRWSPKEALFPRTETLFRFRRAADEVTLEEPGADDSEQVLFAVRPCDAAGTVRLDAIFADADGAYAARRARTTIVSLGCDEAGPECFCTAVGSAPDGTQGSDAQLLPVERGWLVRAVTPKGEELLAPLVTTATVAGDADHAEAAARAARAAAAITANPVAAGWAAALQARFGAPLWEALGRRCVGCSICTYVCPSCTCFDVADGGSEACGERCRSWDSCTFALFTRHSSGHNPRPTQASRFRQRALHKFAYYPQAHGGDLMCTGCGRCVALCPVGLDVRAVVEQVVTAAEVP